MRTAPSRPVHHSDAPASCVRRTTCGCGIAKRPSQGADETAMLAPTAARKPAVDEVRLPWCGSFSTSARRSGRVASSAASPSASRSPGSSTRRPATSTRTTSERSLRRALEGSGGGHSGIATSPPRAHAAEPAPRSTTGT